MAIGYILFNSHAGTGNSKESLKDLEGKYTSEIKYIDITEIKDYKEFFNNLSEDDFVILAGGDGTLNVFANNIEGIEIKNDILYYPCGTGNDFALDFGYKKSCEPFKINKYVVNLPTVTVNEKTYRFINGVGYGIDGYCCEVGDELKKIPGKKINYTAIAIKGLLFYFKPKNATVIVDGVKKVYKKVWIAPTMNGRFYGGGIMPTPDQSRDNNDTLSLMLFHGSGKLKTLIIFPSLFKGAHVKHKECITIIKGKEITVEFDKPSALQIDGETILNVSSYTANTAVKTANKETVNA